MFEMYIEATVRGYHAYLDDASVRIGEILACEMELDNSHDKYGPFHLISTPPLWTRCLSLTLQKIVFSLDPMEISYFP